MQTKINYFFTILILSISTMIAPLSIDSYLPSFNEISIVYKANISTLQLSIAIFTLCSAICMFIIGYCSDILGRKKIILTGLLGYSIASILVIFTKDIKTFLFLRGIQGFFAAMPSSIARSVVRDLYSGINAHKALSLLSILFAISPVIAPIIGGYLQNYFGWKSVFIFMSSYGLILFIIYLFFLKETLPIENRLTFSFNNIITTYTGILKNTEFMLKNLFMALMLNYIGLFIGNIYFMANQLNLASTKYYLLFLPAIGGSMFGAFLSGRLAGKIKSNSFLKISLVITILGLIFIWFNYCILNTKINYFVIVIPWTLIFFAISFSSPSINLNNLNLVDKSNLGIAASFQNLFMTLNFSFVLSVIAPFINGNIKAIYFIPYCISIISIIMWLYIDYIYKKKKFKN